MLSRSAALLVGIPLAIATVDLPSAAMSVNLNLESFQTAKQAAVSQLNATESRREGRALPIFTTPKVREQFLNPSQARTLSLDVFKEQYFRKNIPYGSIIYREARKHSLPPELVAAMVHTESDFRAGLVSNKSAQGLMQIVPSTARLLGIEDPFDPEENIAAGTKYFRYLLNRFDDQTMALAAYNAGEGNVERFGGIPPFAETRSYIEKVRRRTDRYRQRVHNGYIAAARIARDER